MNKKWIKEVKNESSSHIKTHNFNSTFFYCKMNVGILKINHSVGKIGLFKIQNIVLVLHKEPTKYCEDPSIVNKRKLRVCCRQELSHLIDCNGCYTVGRLNLIGNCYTLVSILISSNFLIYGNFI